ncbi:non-specific serine,threonine protein kinase [Sarracenia purpurea var. burkii]
MKLALHFSRLFFTFSGTPQTPLVSQNLISIAATKELHAHLIRTQLHTDPYSMSDVIRSYVLSPPTLREACLTFDRIERPTLLIWNHMIRGLSQGEWPVEAIDMFDRMRDQGLAGNNLTFIFILKACARVSDIVRGRRVHVHSLKLGFESYLYVCNALIHIQANKFEEVLGLFDSMREENVKADAVTMVKMILACSHLGNRDKAESIVKYIADNHVEIDVFLGNSLIDMYGRRGLVGLAREVFDHMAERNIVSWNAMIIGYSNSSWQQPILTRKFKAKNYWKLVLFCRKEF